MTRLYLARHGESRANIEGVLSHRVDNHSLTERGRRQARALAEWLRPRSVTAVYNSPLRRALETAFEVSGRVGVESRAREGLREVNVGNLDGRGDEAAWSVYHRVIGAWRQGDFGARFPGGEDFFEARERLLEVLREITDQHPEEVVAVISHGEILSQVVGGLVELPRGVEPGMNIAAVVVVDWHLGRWMCVRWNSVEHLDSLRGTDSP